MEIRLKSQSGNVLFLILIAVALFAAISYAVTSSNRSNGTNISKDKAKANAASIVQYSASLRHGILRMKLSNGCTDGTLDFSNSIYKRNDDTATIGQSINSNAPTDKKCNLFDKAGGQIVPFILPHDAITPNTSATSTSAKDGHASIYIHQIAGVGTSGSAGTESANDIVLRLHSVTLETCLAINNLLGVANPSGAPPAYAFTGSSGTYLNGSLASTSIISSPELDGKMDFCMTGSSAVNFAYYTTLVAR